MARLREKQLNGVIPSEKSSTLQTDTRDLEDRRTDPARWRLLDDRGRQTWHYLQSEQELESWPQSSADRYFLGLPTVSASPAQHPRLFPSTELPFTRDYLHCPSQRCLWTPLAMLPPTSPSSNFRLATGPASTAVLCFSCRGSSSPGMLPRRQSQSTSQLRSDDTFSPASILSMEDGDYTLKARAPSLGRL